MTSIERFLEFVITETVGLASNNKFFLIARLYSLAEGDGENSAKRSTFEWQVTIENYVQPKQQCKLVFL